MIKRSATALILGTIMIAGLLLCIESALVILFVIYFFSCKEWNQHFVKREGRFATTGFFLSVLLIILLILYQVYQSPSLQSLFYFNAALVFILFVYGLSVWSRKNWTFCQSWYSGIFYICFPILIVCLYLNSDFNNHRWIVLGLIIINWSNDVFAYFTGMLFGKHSLAADISPKKTIEGAIGGLLAAILCTWIVNEYLFVDSLSIIKIVLLGFAIWLAGTSGDLYESKLKRTIGIKDSGQILPGHGGFLDRFDSFFFILPVGIFVLSI